MLIKKKQHRLWSLHHSCVILRKLHNFPESQFSICKRKIPPFTHVPGTQKDAQYIKYLFF